MASSRHLGRVVALQAVYEYGFRGGEGDKVSLEQILERHFVRHEKNLSDRRFASELAEGVVAKAAELDELISPVAPQRPLAEIPPIDRHILQISVYELIYKGDVPPKVAINEAVELAKHYGGDNSSKFVNGVLGTLYRQLSETGRIAADPAGREDPPGPVAPPKP